VSAPNLPITAAIRFESDGYDITGARLMGRQSAGNGFLRAAVAASRDAPLVGYGPRAKSGEAFSQLVRSIDRSAETRWITSDQLDAFNAVGVCYRPDPVIGPEARLRLRVGPARHCLCGVTHSMSTSVTAGSIADYLTAPLMPWDALICTTAAARSVVDAILEEQASYLAWRFGTAVTAPAPQLPVIPLGVHCADFSFSGGDRARARQALGLADNEVVALYAGRLAFADKAHPFAMYVALQAAAERTQKPIVLIMAGRFLNQTAEQAYRDGLKQFCPGVRGVIVDGAQFDAYRECWAAADLFVSASDSIQETFGLTPVEAMAAGLPCVISDWNGYRDTVRDGIDGFRVRTWAPAPPLGEPLARRYEADVIGAGRFSWGVTAAVSLDLSDLIDRLSALVSNRPLRTQMGEAARVRAQASFDWTYIFAQYQRLWAELNAHRMSVDQRPDHLAYAMAAPSVAAGHLDPFQMFGAYPSAQIGPGTWVSLRAGASISRYGELVEHPLFPEFNFPAPLVEALFTFLEANPASIETAAAKTGWAPGIVVHLTAALAKMGLVHLSAEAP